MTNAVTEEHAPARVYAFRTEYEGTVDITLYTTADAAQRAAIRHIEDWYGHREAMLGGQLVWASEDTDRLAHLQKEAADLLPIRKALNAKDYAAAIDLYNEWNPDDYTCSIDEMDVQP